MTIINFDTIVFFEMKCEYYCKYFISREVVETY